MNDAFGLRDILLDIYRSLVDGAAEMVPRVLTAVVVVAIGLLVAKLLERLLRTAFLRLQVDKLLDKVGITQTLRGFGVKGSLSVSTARLVYWLIVILFVRSAANSAGFHIVAEAIASFFSYLPNLVAAFFVLMLGNVVAQFAGRAVEQAGRDSGVDYAATLGRIVAAGILFIVTIMAITQLGIDTEMIRTVVIIGLSGGVLGLALSFGLGAREITRNLLAGFYARKLFRVGDPLEVAGVRGRLTAVTATQTLLQEDDGRTVSIANTTFLEHAARQ